MITPLVLSLTLLSAPAPTKQMGRIDFPVSGNAACKKSFTDGMLAMHSFMYDDAREAFETAVKADPGCAMARWGIALSYSHLLWGEEDLVKSKAALDGIVNLDRLPAKERALIEAAKVLQQGAGDYRTRVAAWKNELGRLHETHPADDEIALLYALSLISASERLTKTKLLMESAAISTDVFQRKPKHPGAAHYLIHACDTSDHAILALPAARRYAQIAPSASHAQHMPAHIFVHLGMWEDVAKSNEVSWAASEIEMKKWKKSPDLRDWHSYSWLAVAYLELGRVKKAGEILDDFRAQLAKHDGPETRFGYALTTYGWLSHTGKWDETAARVAPLLAPLPLEPGQAEGSVACSMHAPGGGGPTRPPFGLISGMIAQQILAEAAMRRGDEAGVAAALEAKRRVTAQMDAWKNMLPKDGPERAVRLETAFTAMARARNRKTPESVEAAIDAAKKLAEIRETSANGPAFETPYHVHLGELLLENGRAKEALAAFDAALERYPGHSGALDGARKAATAAGEPGVAESRERVLKAQWSKADADAAPAPAK